MAGVNQILFVFFNLCLVGGVLQCDFPPSLWCSSKEIAIACKVENHCDQHVWHQVTEATPVEFGLYYESLCGACKKFIQSQLFPTWSKLSSIMNVTLVPYGNAREHQEGSKWVFDCQHGTTECFGNLVETCAIFLSGNITQYFPFIDCVETSKETPDKSYVACASQHSFSQKDLDSCIYGDMGNKLEHQMAVKTSQLNPPHTFVPWVTLNGVHNEKIQEAAQENLLKLICDTYKGAQPEACKQQERRRQCPKQIQQVINTVNHIKL